MIKSAIILLITLSVASTGSYLIARNALVATSIAEDKMTAIQIMNTLKSSVASQGGNYYVPLGVNDVTKKRHLLPTFFGINRFSSNGDHVIYCPYALNTPTLPNAEVTVDDETSYDVTISTNIRAGVELVVASDAPPVNDLLAAVIMPRSSGDTPTCADITRDPEGRYKLSNGRGRVYAITHQDVSIMYRDGINEYISSTMPSGALTDVMNEASAMLFSDAVITLEAGETFGLNNSLIFTSGDKIKPRVITIRSSTPGVNATISSSDNISIDFENIRLQMEDIALAGNISLSMRNTEGSLNNVSAPSLSAKNSDIQLFGGSFGANSTTSPVLHLDNSKVTHAGPVTISGSSTPISAILDSTWVSQAPQGGSTVININGGGSSGGILLMGSNMSLRDTTINTTNGFDYVIASDRTSLLSMNNAAWLNTGSVSRGFYLAGTSVFRNSSLNGSAGVQTGLSTEAGAITEFSNSNLGTASNKFNTGWRDAGSASISGNGDIYATTCLEDGRFSEDDTTFTFEYNDRYALNSNPSTGSVTLTDETRETSLDIDGFFVSPGLNCL